MISLELQEHEGLFGKGKMEAEETWIAENKDAFDAQAVFDAVFEYAAEAQVSN